MPVIGWVDTDSILELWSDAPDYEAGGLLADLLDSAYDICAGYAPKPLLEPAPARYKLAQVYLTKHLWARKNTGDSSTMGPDGFAMSTYPLVLEARSLLRPKTSPFAGMR